MNIPSAHEVWQNQKKDDYEKAIDSVVRAIKKASEQGYRYTCFDPRPCQYYDSVKKEFAAKGYYFTPTGYIGGVWQRSERINW